MLLRFSASNHGSILERQELSLVATSLKDNNDGLIQAQSVPGGHVLPVVIIYGPNASGKSTILDAYTFIEEAVISSHPGRTAGSKIPRNAFALGVDSENSVSEYDMDFIVDNIRYHFGFTVTDNEFTSEWLYAYPSGRKQMLYERTGEKTIEFGRALKGRNRVIADLMRPNSLYLSAALQNNHESLTKIAGIFLKHAHIEQISVDAWIISNMFQKNDIDEKVISFLKKMKTGIVGYRKTEQNFTEEQLAIHRDLDEIVKRIAPEYEPSVRDKDINIELLHNSRDGRKIALRPEQESSGTRRLLMMLTRIFVTLNEGGCIRIDELDASLHTQAAEAIIQLFSNKNTNPHGAQLITTTHDTNLMSSSLLRRDQIWFVEKDEFGATCLYPLSEIQVRKGDNIEKGYLQGRFGAIPFAGTLDIFREH